MTAVAALASGASYSDFTHLHTLAIKMAAEKRPASELPVLDSVVDYEKLHRVGEGTYGVVCGSPLLA